MRKNSFTKQISANNVVRWIELANQHSAVALNQATMFNGLMSIRRMIDGKPFIQSQRDTYSLVPSWKGKHVLSHHGIRSHCPQQVVDLSVTNGRPIRACADSCCDTEMRSTAPPVVCSGTGLYQTSVYKE